MIFGLRRIFVFGRKQTSHLWSVSTAHAGIKPPTCYKLAMIYFREVIFFAHTLPKIWSQLCDTIDYEQVGRYCTHLLDVNGIFQWKLKTSYLEVAANFLLVRTGNIIIYRPYESLRQIWLVFRVENLARHSIIPLKKNGIIAQCKRWSQVHDMNRTRQGTCTFLFTVQFTLQINYKLPFRICASGGLNW